VVPGQPADLLRTPAGTSAAHAPVTTPIPGHDRPAHVAAWRISHVDELFERVSRVIQPAIDDRGAAGSWLLATSQTYRRWRGLVPGRGRLGHIGNVFLERAALARS